MLNSGLVGVGSSTPWAKFSIEQDSNVPVFVVSDQGSSTPHLIVYGAGRIGIGTSTPYARLSVVGEAVATYFSATSTTATSTFLGAVGVGTSTPA